MQVLLGDSAGKKTLEIFKKHGIGRMFVERIRKIYPGEPWGMDNGAYICWKKGVEFDEGGYLMRVNEALKLDTRPYMAILPDIVAGGDASLEFSLSWKDTLPPQWPWYLAVQDGMDPRKVIDILPQVDGLFLGGTDDYKQYAGWWCKIAHVHQKKFHFGRAGTLKKIAHAIMIGSDSMDSAFPLWTKDRLFSFIQALSQPHFEGMRHFCRSPLSGGLVEIE